MRHSFPVRAANGARRLTSSICWIRSSISPLMSALCLPMLNAVTSSHRTKMDSGENGAASAGAIRLMAAKSANGLRRPFRAHRPEQLWCVCCRHAPTLAGGMNWCFPVPARFALSEAGFARFQEHFWPEQSASGTFPFCARCVSSTAPAEALDLEGRASAPRATQSNGWFAVSLRDGDKRLCSKPATFKGSERKPKQLKNSESCFPRGIRQPSPAIRIHKWVNAS